MDVRRKQGAKKPVQNSKSQALQKKLNKDLIYYSWVKVYHNSPCPNQPLFPWQFPFKTSREKLVQNTKLVPTCCSGELGCLQDMYALKLAI